MSQYSEKNLRVSIDKQRSGNELSGCKYAVSYKPLLRDHLKNCCGALKSVLYKRMDESEFKALANAKRRYRKILMFV